MNRLTGTILWNRTNETTVAEDTKFSHSHLELVAERTNVFAFDEAGYHYNAATGVLVSIMGYVTNIYDLRDRYGIDSSRDVEIVERLYSTVADRSIMALLDVMDGVFFVLVYDDPQERAHLAQSEFGCPLPVYYTNTPEGLVFSTSMKLLLQKTGIKRRFHRPAVKDFMSYGEIVSDENTIVEGVKKLVTQRNLIVDVPSRKMRYESFRGRDGGVTREEAEARLIYSVGNTVTKLSRQLRSHDRFLTLTAGWDSNLILSFLYGDGAPRINAVTINGGGTTNEVPSVEHVLRFYSSDRVKHLTETMDSSLFDFMPNVVWIYEGYMVQCGMLLRYALARLIGGAGGNAVFLGSGADPILNTEMGPGGNRVYEPYADTVSLGSLSEVKRTVRNMCKSGLIGDLYFAVKGETGEQWMRRKSLRAGFRERYNTQIDYNMKMHELMLNSFGIQGLYPFMNRDTAQCARPLRPWNDSKSLYKEKAREYLAPDISRVLKKSGSVVDTESLFDANRHWFAEMTSGEFIREVLTPRQVSRIRANPADYPSSLLRVLYLCLFERLILSGDFDDQFGKAHVAASLAAVFGQRTWS